MFKLYSIIAFCTGLLIVNIGVMGIVHAQTAKNSYLSVEDVSDFVDGSLVEDKFNIYDHANQLYLYRYNNTASSGGKTNFKRWYKDIYYNFIVQEKFVDLPFNYIISSEGVLYKGKRGYFDVQPDLTEQDLKEGKGVVLLFYPYYQTGYQSKLVNSLQTLINTLQIKDLYEVDLQIEPGVDTKPAKLKVINKRAYAGDQVFLTDGRLKDRLYKVEFNSIDYPTTTNQGKNFTVNSKFTNKSLFPLYNNAETNFFLTTCLPKEKKSQFTESDTWSSAADVTGFTEDYILPDQVFAVDFKMNNPLQPGSYQESFCARIYPDQWFLDTKFKVSFKSKNIGLKLAKIYVPEFGFTNLRAAPGLNSTVKGSMDEGELVILLDDSQTLWYKIQTADGQVGWVYAPNLRSL